MNKRQELGIVAAVIAANIGLIVAIGPTPPLNSSKQAEPGKIGTVGASRETRLSEARARAASAEIKRQEYETNADSLEQQFFDFVDRNNDHYPAPGEIMHALDACGYHERNHGGDVSLDVDRLAQYMPSRYAEKIRAERESGVNGNTHYTVSIDFIANCKALGKR